MLTSKMRDQVEKCPSAARSNAGMFSPRPQVQVSAELPMSYSLYSTGSATYMCPCHEVCDAGPVVLAQARFDTRVQAVVVEVTEIASRYTGWEAQ